MALNVVVFCACLALVLWASELLAKGLDRLGSKLHLSDELLGVLTALGADSPEISSAVVALLSNQRDLGVGIVLGSNLFNLAALLGLGAVIAGYVRAPSAATIFNGSVALAVTLVSAALIARSISPLVATILVLLIFIPYLYVLAVGPNRVRELPIPSSWKRFLVAAGSQAKQESRQIAEEAEQEQREKRIEEGETDVQSWKPAWLVLPALAIIVLGSIGMVKYATAIGKGWLPDAVLGTFILASLTGLPNAFTAVRLAQHGKGAAVLTETFNSNTINIVVGLLLPAMIFGEHSPNSLVILDLCWLVFMTAIAVILSAHSSKLTRTQGVILVALYLGFIAAWTFFFFRR